MRYNLCDHNYFYFYGNTIVLCLQAIYLILHVISKLAIDIISSQPPESQTTATDPVYVEIGPSTIATSQENFLLSLGDDKVEYTEVKQTAKDRKVNTDSMPGDAASIIIAISLPI